MATFKTTFNFRQFVLTPDGKLSIDDRQLDGKWLLFTHEAKGQIQSQMVKLHTQGRKVYGPIELDNGDFAVIYRKLDTEYEELEMEVELLEKVFSAKNNLYHFKQLAFQAFDKANPVGTSNKDINGIRRTMMEELHTLKHEIHDELASIQVKQSFL